MNLNPIPSGFGTDEKSALIPPPAYAGPSNTFQTTFASLSLHMSDRIRLLQFPPSEIAAIREVIRRVWTEGIQAERPYSLSHEFKLRGYPWGGQGSYAIPARMLMREIFAYLFSVGWILTSTTDVSKKQFDKDTLIFRHQPMPPPPSTWCAISFNQSDRLRLIGAPPELATEFRTLLKGMGKLQDEFWKDQSKNGYEFKIYGSPWCASGEETIMVRLLLLKCVELLESQGWSLYASVDQNNGTQDTSETDSWYCVKAKDWVPGNTVFHR